MTKGTTNILKKAATVIGSLLALIVFVYLIAFAVSRFRGSAEEAAFYQKIDDSFTIFAHQAGEGEYPSNSMLGFQAAADLGIQVLDMDVFETKDQHFVLFHDQTLDYRTDGSGRVDEKTLAELEQVNFAYNWSPEDTEDFPYRDAPVSVTTLDQVFEKFSDSLFNIEIKQVAEGSVSRFCETIKEYGLESSVLVSSNPDNPDTHMERFRSECPEVETAALESEVRQFYILHRLGLAGLFRPQFSSLQVPEYSGSNHIVTKRFVDDAHRLGIKVYPWTIDRVEDAQRLKDLGVDGVNSSFPRRLSSSGL